MKYYFGFDGGATKCRFAISNIKGDILFKAEGPSSNIYAVGKESVKNTIKVLINKGLNYLNIEKENLYAGCFGSAGIARKNEIDYFQIFFNNFLPNSKVYICSDAEILLVGGLNSLSGICLIGGTGAVCFGRTNEGEIIRAGGFGWRLGDEGSGWDIANTAISRTLKSKEQRDLLTSLDSYIVNYFNLNRLEDIISYVNNNLTTKSDIGNFARYVTIAAEYNDLLALDILEKAGQNLFELVDSVIKRMPKNYNKKIILAGGVLKNDKFVKESFLKNISKYSTSFDLIINPIHNALEGSLRIATSL